MKKLLLTGAMLMALSFSAKAQNYLYYENFDGLTVGNVGTDLTGETAGQGGIYTLVPVGGANSDFQVVTGGFSGNAFQISGGNLPTGTTEATNNIRYAYAHEITTGWNNRTEGNDAVSADFYFKSGTTPGSTTMHRALVYSTDFRVMGGFQYNTETSRLDGLVHYSNGTQEGTYRISLFGPATGTGLVIEQNEWFRLGFAIDPATGVVVWSSPDILVENDETGEMEPLFTGFESSFAVGTPGEFDIVTIPGTNNSAVSTALFDNILVNATDGETLAGWLSVKEVATADKFTVSPNPANSIVTVASANNFAVNAISVTDLNGRVIKNMSFDAVSEAQVNVSDLANGVYLMTISSDKGAVTKKIVKN